MLAGSRASQLLAARRYLGQQPLAGLLSPVSAVELVESGGVVALSGTSQGRGASGLEAEIRIDFSHRRISG